MNGEGKGKRRINPGLKGTPERVVGESRNCCSTNPAKRKPNPIHRLLRDWRALIRIQDGWVAEGEEWRNERGGIVMLEG